MHDKVVCLGCGLIVGGPGEWGCSCPPPSIQQRSIARPPRSSAGPYRALPKAAVCPRCDGRMVEAGFHDATVLDCTDCGGLFVPKQVTDALMSGDRRALRLAFPQRERVAEPTSVRYLKCALCSQPMNRENFGLVSGVVVDVCKTDGIWFDAGEINAVIAFVEGGGLARGAAKKDLARAQENARLVEKRRTDHEAAVKSAALGDRTFRGRAEGNMLHALSRWLINR